jgi:hypothetical protein
MSRLAVGSVALGVLLAVYLGVLFLVQRSLLFPAPRAPTPPGHGPAEILQVRSDHGPIQAFYLAPLSSGPGPAPVLLFAHGNAELASSWVGEFDEPRNWGWGVLLLEYPGYGGSPGKPSEPAITAAALAAYDWARRDPRVDATRIVPYGRSLGGGPAARVAAERPVAGLILESAFTSVRALARRYLAPGFLVRDPFDNLAALRHYRGPLLVLHGSRDEIIPIAHGRTLAAAVPGAEFHALACGHNDCPRPWGLIKPFLAMHGLMPQVQSAAPLPDAR